VGYAFDRILLYVTGGGAYGNIEAIANGVSNNNTEFGWTAGAGIEAALAYNLTVKVEYLYVDLGNGSCTTACGSPPSGLRLTFESRRGFPGEWMHASLAHANRNFHHS